MGWGCPPLRITTSKRALSENLSPIGNPGGHTDTHIVRQSLVNPILALKRKVEDAAGPVKFRLGSTLAGIWRLERKQKCPAVFDIAGR
jgi:hypothetical protein